MSELESVGSKNRLRRFVFVVVTAVVLGVLFLLYNISTGASISWALVCLLIIVTIGIVGIVTAVIMLRESKRGIPIGDERSKAITMKAGYLAFFISLYFLLITGFIFSSIDEEIVSYFPTAEWLFFFVAAMGVIFILVLSYLKIKGVP